MSSVIPGGLILLVFSLISVLTFDALLNSWETYAGDYNSLQTIEVERLNTSISIVSAGPTHTDLDCTNFTASVLNTGSEDIIPITDGNVVVDYTDTGNSKITGYLENATTAVTGNRWTAASFSVDKQNPGQWDSGETATIDFSIASAMKADTTGPVIINTPSGSSDVEYLACPEHLYFHAETNSIASVDYYKMVTDTTAEVTGVTISSPISTLTTGRISPTSNDGKSTFLLTDSAIIPAATWTTTYRVKRDKADFGFAWSTNATDISLAITGSWQDIDISSAVPSEATGVIVEVVNTGTVGTYSGMVRGKEDTRDYLTDTENALVYPSSHRWQVVKIDSGQLIQGYIEDVDIDFKLLGYTIGSDPEYFAVPPDVTPGTTGSWTTVDLSANVDSDADGVILLIDNTDNSGRNYGVREVGSSFATISRKLGAYENTMYMVGIDASDQFDVFIENSNIKVYLVGQTKGSVVYYIDDVAVADPTLGSWQQLDADTDVAPAVSSDAVGLLLWAENIDLTTDFRASFREGDSTDDWNGDLQRDTHFQAAVGITSANAWDEQLENAVINVSVAGYTRLVRLDVHADIDIVIRDASGAVRATLATEVAESSNITETTWQTLTATYSFSEYTVVEATDYLEIDLYADSTANTSGESVSLDFRLDDNTLSDSDQTRISVR